MFRMSVYLEYTEYVVIYNNLSEYMVYVSIDILSS